VHIYLHKLCAAPIKMYFMTLNNIIINVKRVNSIIVCCMLRLWLCVELLFGLKVIFYKIKIGDLRLNIRNLDILNY